MTIVDLDPAHRLAAVRRLGVLEDTPSRELTAVADLAARVCGVPMATINLMTDVEQHSIAPVRWGDEVCSLDESMCARILHEEAPVVVEDCREDPRFRDNAFVDGRRDEVRFYASHRLVTPEGVAIGTLCVFDREPRHVDEDQLVGLSTLADRVVDILELSLRSRELSASLREVEAVRAQLETSNERLSSFAGQVSHDLKTPLTSMALALTMIREELAAQTAVGETLALPLLERAISGSTRMAALIDEVLAYATLGSDLNRDAVDLGVVLEHVRADLWEQLVDVTFTTDALPVVHGDGAQLRAVVQNLLDNAAKYADRDRQAVVHVGAHRTSGGWRVEVTDNGRGVPEGQHESVFSPLVRADDDVAGSGIGLSTCRRVVEAHGGTIGLRPAAHGGTTAWFELPD